MYTEVDVFVSNYTLIDPEIYQLWIEGCSCEYIRDIISSRWNLNIKSEVSIPQCI